MEKALYDLVEEFVRDKLLDTVANICNAGIAQGYQINKEFLMQNLRIAPVSNNPRVSGTVSSSKKTGKRGPNKPKVFDPARCQASVGPGQCSQPRPTDGGDYCPKHINTKNNSKNKKNNGTVAMSTGGTTHGVGYNAPTYESMGELKLNIPGNAAYMTPPSNGLIPGILPNSVMSPSIIPGALQTGQSSTNTATAGKPSPVTNISQPVVPVVTQTQPLSTMGNNLSMPPPVINGIPQAVPTNPVQNLTSNIPVATPVQNSPSIIPVEMPVQNSPSIIPVEAGGQNLTSNIPVATPVQNSPSIIPVEAGGQNLPSNVPVTTPVQNSPSNVTVETPVQNSPSNVTVETPVQNSPSNVIVETPVQNSPSNVTVETPVQTSYVPSDVATFAPSVTETNQLTQSVQNIPNVVNTPAELTVNSSEVGSYSNTVGLSVDLQEIFPGIYKNPTTQVIILRTNDGQSYAIGRDHTSLNKAEKLSDEQKEYLINMGMPTASDEQIQAWLASGQYPHLQEVLA